MWLSVLIGLVVGFILNVLMSSFFKVEEIVAEDQAKSKNEARYQTEKLLEENSVAVAMKERFSESEWREVKLLPHMMFGLVALSGASRKSKVNQTTIKYYIDIIYSPEKVDNPLLRMMLIDHLLDLNDQFADMNPLMIMGSLNKITNTPGFSAIMSGASPESMVFLENTLNPEEFREFTRALFQFTMKMAYAGGEPEPSQVKLIMEFFMNFASSKQDLMAMFNDVSLK